MDPLAYINRSIASREPGWLESATFTQVLTYLDSKTPEFTKVYEREFGRSPDPAGVAELISRETGGQDVNHAGLGDTIS